MINGDRIKQAREIRGWTQKHLAQRIGIKQTTVSQIESCLLQPSDEIVQRIVLQTGFPLSFFKESNTADFPLGSLLYRKRSSLTLRDRSQARQYARVIFEMLKKMETNLKWIRPCIPRLEDDPVACATQARSSLGLSPDNPIDNLMQALESKGVVVFALPLLLAEVDAFSIWAGNDQRRPIIALAKNIQYGDRLRFNLAHELGHLVMHQAMTGAISKIENEANEFAHEFLTPRDIINTEITKPVTITSLIPLKKRWKVSIQFLIRRAYMLNKINPDQYRNLMIQLSSQPGGKKNEPLKIVPEKPRLLGQLAEMKYGVPVDCKTLASQMNLPLQLIKETLEIHALKVRIDAENESGTVVNFMERRRIESAS